MTFQFWTNLTNNIKRIPEKYSSETLLMNGLWATWVFATYIKNSAIYFNVSSCFNVISATWNELREDDFFRATKTTLDKSPMRAALLLAKNARN